MEIHYKFRDGEQRKFLLEVASKSGLSTEQLAAVVGFSARNYRDWLREKFAIASNAVDILSKNFNVQLPESRSILEERWREIKRKAGIVGGHACFKIHGSPGTLEGRRRGGSKALTICREKGLIPKAKTFIFPKKNKDLAEFVGILLGDGGITPAQVGITLNRAADKEYIPYVVRLGLKLFGEKGSIFKKKDCNADVIVYSGVNLVKYLLSIGLKVGDKVRQQVSVPRWIETNKSYSHACLRGLMDTDGGVFAHKYRVNSREYVYNNICFTNESVPLLIFTKNLLESLGMHPKFADYPGGSKKIWLYNQHEVDRYLKIVGSSNTRLLRFSRN